jgi:hypothetical protein
MRTAVSELLLATSMHSECKHAVLFKEAFSAWGTSQPSDWLSTCLVFSKHQLRFPARICSHLSWIFVLVMRYHRLMFGTFWQQLHISVNLADECWKRAKLFSFRSNIITIINMFFLNSLNVLQKWKLSAIESTNGKFARIYELQM